MKLAILFIILSMSLVACSKNVADNSSLNITSEQGVKVINIEAYSWGFNVNGPQINKGDTVMINFTTTSGTHGLSLEGYDISIPATSAGQSRTVTFVADKSGNFTFRCNVPCGEGHSRMVGTITVH